MRNTICLEPRHGQRFVALVLLLGACTQDESPVALTRSDSAVSAVDSPTGKVDAAIVSTLDSSIASIDSSAPAFLDAAPAVVREAGAGLDDDKLLTLAAQLISLCPSAAPNDAAARALCADGLTGLDALRDVTSERLLWGAQPAGLALAQVPEQASLTHLNPRVWRRLYLSTLMFESPARVEEAGRYRALRVPVRFRNGLDAGDYPYPFWHAEKKWASYEQATSIVFLFEGRQLVAAVRSEQTDPSRPHSVRTWDGAWTWNEGQEPHVTLFRSLFSPANPYVTALDESYRALAVGLREQTCTACHSPNNAGMAKPLDILNYPNQSLSGRHGIVSMLDSNQMPPQVGIADTTLRASLLAQAKTFAALGDQALAFEGEPSANAVRP